MKQTCLNKTRYSLQGADLEGNDSESSSGNLNTGPEILDSDHVQYFRDRRNSAQLENRFLERQLRSELSLEDKKYEDSPEDDDDENWQARRRQSWHERISKKRRKPVNSQNSEEVDRVEDEEDEVSEEESEYSEQEERERFLAMFQQDELEECAHGGRQSALSHSDPTQRRRKLYERNSNAGAHIRDVIAVYKQAQEVDRAKSRCSRLDTIQSIENDMEEMSDRYHRRPRGPSSDRRSSVQRHLPKSPMDVHRNVSDSQLLYLQQKAQRRQSQVPHPPQTKPFPIDRHLRRRSTDLLLDTEAFGNPEPLSPEMQRMMEHAGLGPRPDYSMPDTRRSRRRQSRAELQGNYFPGQSNSELEINVEFVEVPRMERRRSSIFTPEEEIQLFAAANRRRQSGNAMLLGYELKKLYNRRLSADDLIKENDEEVERVDKHRRHSADEQIRAEREGELRRHSADSIRRQSVGGRMSLDCGSRRSSRSSADSAASSRRSSRGSEENLLFYRRRSSLPQRERLQEGREELERGRMRDELMRDRMKEELSKGRKPSAPSVSTTLNVNGYAVRRHSADDRLSKMIESAEGSMENLQKRRHSAEEDKVIVMQHQERLQRHVPPTRRHSNIDQLVSKIKKIPSDYKIRRMSMSSGQIMMRLPEDMQRLGRRMSLMDTKPQTREDVLLRMMRRHSTHKDRISNVELGKLNLASILFK